MQHAFLDPDEFWTAFKPVLDLMGATPLDIYDHSGVTIRWDSAGTEVSFKKVATPGSNEPWTVVKVGDGEGQEYAYDVRFHISPRGVVKRLWPNAEFHVAQQVESA